MGHGWLWAILENMDGSDSDLARPTPISNSSCSPLNRAFLGHIALVCPTFHDGPQICLPKRSCQGHRDCTIKDCTIGPVLIVQSLKVQSCHTRVGSANAAGERTAWGTSVSW